jgi:hypothetical protein
LLGEKWKGTLFQLENFASTNGIEFMEVVDNKSRSSDSVRAFAQGLVAALQKHPSAFEQYLDRVLSSDRDSDLIEELNTTLRPQGYELSTNGQVRLLQTDTTAPVVAQEIHETPGWIEERLRFLGYMDCLSSYEEAISSRSQGNFAASIGQLRNFVHCVVSSVSQTDPTHFGLALEKLSQDKRLAKLLGRDRWGMDNLLKKMDTFLSLYGSHSPVEQPDEMDARLAASVSLGLIRYILERT